MNRSKEFAKNTFLLFIGKFATQFMSLLLLPLYTRFLLADDYGIVDLFQSYISLFVPLLTLRIDSAVFRFLIDQRKDEKGKVATITNIVIILFACIVPTFIVAVILMRIINIQYFGFVVCNLLILMISSVLMNILRGLGKNKEYSIVSIVIGFITLVCNIILICLFKFPASSILISASIGNLIGIVYIIVKINLFKMIDFKLINFSEIKKILKYSFPMIPNSLSWWVVNVSDRTVISVFLGTAFNGIYTVSGKFSNIINSVFSIFNMSWQENASLHIDDKDKDTYFSQMINSLFMLFATVSLAIVAFLPLCYTILVGEEYWSSYKFIPLLLYANLWNVLIGLIGGIYIAKKKTKEVANTTIVSAIINLVIDILLIKKIGLYAACISTLISYFVMCVYRYYDCQKYVKVKLNIKSIIIFSVLFIASSYIYMKNIIWLHLINVCFVFIYSVFVNKKILIEGINIVKKKFNR